MMRKLIISVILAATAGAASASAHPVLPGETVVVERSETGTKLVQRQISASEAKRIALRRHPGGKVVDIRRDGNVYVVRIDTRSNGRVVDVKVDASSGRIVG
jgi:uncharacterized membrane protein YkoI